VTAEGFGFPDMPRVVFAVDKPGAPQQHLTIPVGQSAALQTLAGCVRIHVRWISRGEVAVGLEAPLSIDFQRPERPSKRLDGTDRATTPPNR
jgi:hypothetical protein